MSVKFHVKRFLERMGILKVEIPWHGLCVPDSERWYYHCWFPPMGLKDNGTWRIAGGYEFD